MTPSQERIREQVRGRLAHDLPFLRNARGADAVYLRDVTLNGYSGRSRPADLCVMRDAERRYVLEAVCMVMDRSEWEVIRADFDRMRRWEGAVQYVTVALPGFSQAALANEVPEGWGLCTHDARGSGFMFDLQAPARLNAAQAEFTLALQRPDGKPVRLEDTLNL